MGANPGLVRKKLVEVGDEDEEGTIALTALQNYGVMLWCPACDALPTGFNLVPDGKNLL